LAFKLDFCNRLFGSGGGVDDMGSLFLGTCGMKGLFGAGAKCKFGGRGLLIPLTMLLVVLSNASENRERDWVKRGFSSHPHPNLR